ncbi:NfeD family protein [Aliarcobacter butzleri]|uniref:NfeD family protein n=1 Tax=Aliarcobacter butzleri TaxID=28197 RepID=UPI001EDA2D1F|nr:nodulation efficiency protein D [Aliarcobacter butzleri]MCG3676873.1 nodulation efficiency protein D [Aliarcobacter butzleri]MCG3708892.1 nodulation efficiency protein D [Aliarcobacter butzleri]
METLTMLSAIDPYTLLAIGVTLVALEVFIASFIIIWFGVGFLVVAIISFFFIFSGAIWQLAVISLLSLIFLFLFRRKSLDKFFKSQTEVSDNFFDEKGIGEIRNSKVFYKGTYWEIDSSLDAKEFVEGEKVEVLKTSNNMATIQKR